MNKRIDGSKAVAFLLALLTVSAPLTLFLSFSSSALGSPDDVIAVEGNAALLHLAHEEGWTGDGTEGSPILVPDLAPKGSGTAPLISLTDTNLYVRLTRLNLSAHPLGAGMALTRVSNVMVDNSSFHGQGVAIELLSCQNIIVQDSGFTNNTIAIKAMDSRSCQFLRGQYQNNNVSLDLTTSSINLIKDNTFHHVEEQIALNLTSSSENSVLNNDLYGGLYGINLTDSRANLFRSNDLRDMRTGLLLGDLSSGNVLVQNTFADIVSDAMEIRNAARSKMYSNVMTGCSILIVGDVIAFGTQTIPENNTVNGRPVVYLNNFQGSTPISRRTVGELILGNVRGFQVDEFVVVGGSVGMCIGHSQDVTVSNSTLTGLDRGIFAMECTGLELQRNEYGFNGVGTEIFRCSSSLCLDEVHRGDGIGKRIDASTNCMVVGSYFENVPTGIYVTASSGTGIDGNQFIDCPTGVFVFMDHGVHLLTNIYGNCEVGIDLLNSTGTIVEQDLIEDGDTAISVENCTVTLQGCLIDGARLGIFLNSTNWTKHVQVSGCEITGTAEEGILVNGTAFHEITQNHLSNTSRGIRLVGTNNTVISGNRCEDIIEDGIVLVKATSTTLNGNRVERCFHGVYLIESQGNLISGNRLHDCYDGLMLLGSHGNAILDNEQINNSRYGINMVSSDQNELSSNNISFNLNDGVRLEGSNGNLVYGNDLVANIGPGVLIRSGSSNLIWDNAFYRNNGAAFSQGASRVQASDSGDSNVWNGTGGHRGQGNFWSDWTTPDLDGDSIVDRPYVLGGAAGAKDHRPLVFPLITVPEAPQDLSGFGRNGRIWISWGPPQQDGHSRILNYSVYRAEGNESMALYAVLGDATEFIDEVVEDGTTYRYQVSASNIMGEGPATAELELRSLEGPMVVYGNEQLRNLATMMGWPGNGSASSPITISDVRIAGQASKPILSLAGTDLFVVMDNVTFESYPQGAAITLFRVANFAVSNCSFIDGGTGIETIASRSIHVSGSLFENNTLAIKMLLTRDSEIVGCDLVLNNDTIKALSCGDNRFEGNHLDLLPGHDGLVLRSSTGDLVINNTVRSGDVGMELTSCHDQSLERNRLSDLGTGIVLGDLTSGTVLTNNTMEDIEGDGLVVRNATFTSMSGNSFLGCSMSILGDAQAFSSNDISPDNTVNGKMLLYISARDGVSSVADLTLGELIVGGVTGLAVSNVTFMAGGSLGACVGFSDEMEVEGCTFAGLDLGIYLKGCEQVSLNGNQYLGDHMGAELFQCDGPRSSDEVFEDCGTGLLVRESERVSVQRAETRSCQVGIAVEESSDCTIDNVTGSSDGMGCSLQGSLRTMVRDGQWLDCGTGVGLLNDSDSSLISNHLSHCQVGMALTLCNRTALSANRYDGCDIGVLSIRSNMVNMTEDRHSAGSTAIKVQGGGNTSIAHCHVENGRQGIVLEHSERNNVTGCEITECSEEGLLVIAGRDDRLSLNHLWFTSNGIMMEDADGCILSENLFHNIDGYGMLLNATRGTTVEGNQAQACLIGLMLIDSEGNQVQNNTLSDCFDGMLLYGSDGNRIEANHQLWSSRYGLVLMGSDGNSIMANNISFNDNYGIGLMDSDGNSLWSNDLVANIGPGVIIQSGSANQLYDNAFFDNNGAGTTWEASHLQAYDAGSGTIWHTSNGSRHFGNFWSEWTFPDLNFDSIVDSPYRMSGPANASDVYPLTSPNLAPPSAPLGIDALGRNATVRLTWSPPATDGDARVLNYTVYKAVENGTLEALVVLGDERQFLDGDVVNGANYTYSVSATNLMGEGPLSEQVRVTPIGVPWSPLNLTANATAQYVTLGWNAPEYLGGSNATHYQVLRGNASGRLAWLSTVEDPAFNDTEVTNGRQYFYAVVAINEAGQGNWSEEVNVTVPVVPPFAPLYVQALLQGSIAIINWTAPTFDGGMPIEGFRIYRSVDGAWTSSPYAFTNSSTSTFADQALQYGRTYAYAVCAYHAVGEGPRTESAAIAPITTPGAPNDLEATMIGAGDDSVVILQWSAPGSDGGSPIIGYVVLRGLSGEALEEVARVSDTNYSDEEVVDIATYIYAIKAFNAAGEGEASGEVVAKKTRTLFGRVLNNDGGPVPNATVTIDGRSDTTDATGLFTIEALPGDRTIVIESEQGSLEKEVSIGLDSSYLGDFVVEQDEEVLGLLGIAWMWWALIIAGAAVAMTVVLVLRRRR